MPIRFPLINVFRTVPVLGAAFLLSCSSPEVVLLESPAAGSKMTRLLVDSSKLSEPTKAYLRQEGLAGDYRREPGQVVATLAKRYQSSPGEALRLALAELSLDRGHAQSRNNPKRAAGHYLDTARLCQEEALRIGASPGEYPDRILYDFGVARLARILHQYRPELDMPVTVPGNLATYRLGEARGPELVPVGMFDTLVPATWMKFEGINMERLTHEGFGTALVGLQKATPEREASDPFIPGSGYGFALNASLRFSGSQATVHLQDLSEGRSTRIAGRTVPLEADFTAPLAYLYGQKRKEEMGGLAAMLRPGSFQDRVRMYALQPFDEDKVPLVLVHGLMANAKGWLPFVNLLLNNEMVRRDYQLVLFNYPTGESFGKNGAALREWLETFRDTYDPKRSNPNMRKMVILGHSMGGILSNLQIRDSGNDLYRLVFDRPIDELQVDEAEKVRLRRIAFFKANPDIDRAIFIAVPHRGSSFASNPIGQFGARLIRLPFDIVDTFLGDIQIVNSLTDVGQELSRRPRNSVNSLRPDNPLNEAILALPVREGVPIHSIIGQANQRAPKIEGTDRVVPYTSAHLEEAVSEVVVLNANHSSVLSKQQTIDEVWRILRLHAEN